MHDHTRADRTDTYGSTPADLPADELADERADEPAGERAETRAEMPAEMPPETVPENDGAYSEQAGAYGTTAPQPAAAHEMPASQQTSQPASQPASMPANGETDADIGAVLFGGGEVERFRARWRELQADFVDDPMGAVRGADHLVDEVMRSLSEVVAAHKQDLESEWQSGDTGETENLRVALRHYRAFFDQLLTA